MNDNERPSALAEAAVTYLEEMGGLEWKDFPEEFAYIHDGRGAEVPPVSLAKAVRGEDGGLVAVAFIEKRYDRPAAPGTGWGGVAVVHDEPRPPRAFTFSDIEGFDNAVTDCDIRGMLQE